MFDTLDDILNWCETQGFIIKEDVAWIGVTQSQMNELAYVAKICPIRGCEYIIYHGVEIRVSEWARERHELHPVWNSTKRTKEYIRKRLLEV